MYLLPPLVGPAYHIALLLSKIFKCDVIFGCDRLKVRILEVTTKTR